MGVRRLSNKLTAFLREQLAPFVGKLFLLTDFGPLERDWPQHTARTVDALDAFGLTADMRVGTSVHLGQTRGARAKGWQFDAQLSICTGLRDRGYGAILPPETEHHNLAASLLGALVPAAETTRDAQPKRQPNDFGHIAVVAATELGAVDVTGGIPRTGSLFALQGVDIAWGRLHWQLLAAEPQ